ncbi:MAG: hydroxymethylglutaryl-CoA lyase [Hyphomicrobiaceae bacterium]|nr:hydroxymethylglutaryl-CoA lyase [Hyphomicrobiaceae bacterium]
MAEPVTIFEVAPRDGLQNERAIVDTAEKIRLVDLLTDCGFAKIEVTSFVSPKWVPQMADASAVMSGIVRRPGVRYSALVPNFHGYEAAKAAGISEIAVFASASEGFSEKNINCSIMESMARYAMVLGAAHADGIPARGYVSCAIACPYDGATDPAVVLEVAGQLLEHGCYEVSLADTIGAGTPQTVDAMLREVMTHFPPGKFAGHFHDTGGRALDNIAVCLDHGLRTFDAAVGGLGGCPFAPGAPGNVSTEAVVAMLESRGFSTGINRAKLKGAAAFATGLRAQAA